MKTDADTSLEKLRASIDKLDESLLTLLKERLLISKQIATIKHQHKLPVHQPSRENAALLHRLELAKHKSIEPTFIKELFSVIFAESKRIQNKQDE